MFERRILGKTSVVRLLSAISTFKTSHLFSLQYKLSLQSEEEIMEKFQKQGIKQKTQHTTYSRYEECCVNCRQTSFSLPIPITATPEFTSKVGE